MKLLMILAPIVMSALAKKKQEGGFDAGALGGYLNGQHEKAAQADPGLGGLLTGMLDSNNDGSIIDDIAGKILGKK